MLLPQLTLNANTLAEQDPYPAQADQDRFSPFPTYIYPDVWLAEAGGQFDFFGDPLMDFGFNIHDSAFSSLPSSKWSAVAADPTPTTAESSSSSAYTDIVISNWHVPLLPSSSATSLPESSPLSDVSVGTSFEGTESEKLPGPVNASQPHRMRLPLVAASSKCSECAQVFASRVQLRRHERTHEKFLCDIHGCGKSFRMSKDLRRHQTTIVHADSALSLRNTLVCPHCGKRTRRKDGHKRHLATHHEQTK